ncbi:MAG: hypothetical protein NT040_16160 [Bacteroidetes bacterium]|nr:hypothetical protein [Bacteroidota bacterium]
MKTSAYFFLGIALFAVLVIGCHKDKKEEEKNKVPLTGKLISVSACKGKSYSMIADTVTTLSCVKYTFEPGNGTVMMKHINAGFNCCPEIACSIAVKGDTIIVQEIEKQGICGCLCLYDLDIELNDASQKCYQVKFIEPYCGAQEPIVFAMDLTANTLGTCCVHRVDYPWGN